MPRTITEYHVQRVGRDIEEGVLLRVQDGRQTELWRFKLEGRQRRIGYTCDGDHFWLTALASFVLADALELQDEAKSLAERFAYEVAMPMGHDAMKFTRGDVIAWVVQAIKADFYAH